MAKAARAPDAFELGASVNVPGNVVSPRTSLFSHPLLVSELSVRPAGSTASVFSASATNAAAPAPGSHLLVPPSLMTRRSPHISPHETPVHRSPNHSPVVRSPHISPEQHTRSLISGQRGLSVQTPPLPIGTRPRSSPLSSPVHSVRTLQQTDAALAPWPSALTSVPVLPKHTPRTEQRTDLETTNPLSAQSGSAPAMPPRDRAPSVDAAPLPKAEPFSPLMASLPELHATVPSQTATDFDSDIRLAEFAKLRVHVGGDELAPVPPSPGSSRRGSWPLALNPKTYKEQFAPARDVPVPQPSVEQVLERFSGSFRVEVVEALSPFLNHILRSEGLLLVPSTNMRCSRLRAVPSPRPRAVAKT